MTAVSAGLRRGLSSPGAVPAIGWAVTALAVSAALGVPWLGVQVALVPLLLLRRPAIGVVAVIACLMVPNSLLGVGMLWQKAALAVLLLVRLVLTSRRDGGSVLLGLVRFAPLSLREHPRVVVAIVVAPALLGLVQVAVIEPLVRRLALERTADYVLAVLVLLALLLETAGRAEAMRVLWAFTAVASAQSLLGLGQAVTGRALLPDAALNDRQVTEATNISGHFRALGTLGHGNSLAIVLVLSLPFVLFLLEDAWHRQDTRRTVIASGLAAVEVLGVLASLSRAGLIAIAVIVGLWAVHLSRRRTTWRTWRRLLAIGAAGLGLMLLVPQTRSILERFGPGSASSRDAGSGDVRLAVARAAWESFLRRPVLGNGLGSDIELLSRENASLWQTGSHNSYLDLLQGGGTVGLVAFGAFLTVLTMAVLPGALRMPTLYLGLAVVPFYALVESFWNSPILPLVTATCAVILVLLHTGDGEGHGDVGSEHASARSRGAV